jgi:hypothetical protein
MMNPLWTATLRNYWPLVGAFAVFIVLNVSEQVWFRPTARRYETVVKSATALGMPVDFKHATPVLPPRLFALLTDNSLPAAEAQEQGNSGGLTAQLLEQMSDLTSRHGMRVIVTEPGPVSLQERAITVRAHLRLRCHYDDFLSLLSDLSLSQRLISIDRFSLSPDPDGGLMLELWVSRYVIKQSGPKP